MIGSQRNGATVRKDTVAIETFIDGHGPAFVILPSYGRDGGDDYDALSNRLVQAGWKVLRPQPRGIAGSVGPMNGLSLHELAEDVAMCIRTLANGPVVVLGHAFGNVLARVLTTDHPTLVTAVVLAAAESSTFPKDIGEAPFIAGDFSVPESKRLDALHEAFFAPGHNASIWLRGWHPETLIMQREAVKVSGLKDSWACGTVPLLQIIAEHDPFTPKKLGTRCGTSSANASRP